MQNIYIYIYIYISICTCSFTDVSNVFSCSDLHIYINIYIYTLFSTSPHKTTNTSIVWSPTVKTAPAEFPERSEFRLDSKVIPTDTKLNASLKANKSHVWKTQRPPMFNVDILGTETSYPE